MTAEPINATAMAQKKALIERAPWRRAFAPLGYPPGAAKPQDSGNQCNGASAEKVHADDGTLRIDVPRDR